MTRDNRKLAIPAILAVTVMVAGLFAFAPVEQASTVHEQVVQGVTGVQTSITETLNVTIPVNTFEYHQVILTADEAFTIVDVTVENSISGADECDVVDFQVIAAYPQQYGTSGTSADTALNTDSAGGFLRTSTATIAQGDDTEDPSTWSLNGENGNNLIGPLTFGPNQNIVFEVLLEELFEDGCPTNGADFDVDVTFHLTGIDLDDVDTTQNNDRPCLNCD